MEALWARARAGRLHPSRLAAAARPRGRAGELARHPGRPELAADPLRRRRRARRSATAAFVVCTERFPGVELVATNVFVREDGAWKLVHHHASGVARPRGEDEGETLH